MDNVHDLASLFDFSSTQDEIFCTSYVTAYYLKNTLKYQGKVFLVGMEGFGSELELMGMTYVGPGPDHIQGDAPEWAKTPLDPEVPRGEGRGREGGGGGGGGRREGRGRGRGGGRGGRGEGGTRVGKDTAGS